MPVASKISQYLHSRNIPYQALHHVRSCRLAEAIERAQAVPELAIKSYLLVDKRGPVLVVIPFLAELDISIINETLSRQFQPVPDVQARKFFKDCDPESFPAFGMAYGLPVIIEAELLEFDHVFAASGCASTLLRLERLAFRTLMQGAVRARVSKWNADVKQMADTNLAESNGALSLSSAAKKLEKIYKLPPMPETAVRIMHMISDPETELADLSTVIERDPSLSAQVMRYARSALFAYPGELKTIQEAINRVLGFDRVSQLAMGLAAAKAFTIPKEGPLGLQRFWQHALYAGVLNQALAQRLGPSSEIDDKEAYLAGLLHNFGILLIGHLFPPEFKMLNRLREGEPEASMAQLEQQVFGIGGAQEFIALGHGSLGAILLKLWDLPEAVIKVAGMHQKSQYQGEMQHYVLLTQLTNSFLAAEGVGDEPPLIDQSDLCEILGFEPEDTRAFAMQIIEQCRSLDDMVSHIAA